MENIIKWRVYCITEKCWKFIWSIDRPDSCPSNQSHTINMDSINKISEINRYLTLLPENSPFKIRDFNFYICNTASNNIHILLCPANFNQRTIIIIKLSKPNQVTIGSDAGDNFILSGTKTQIKLFSNGTHWIELDMSSNYGEDPHLMDGDIRLIRFDKHDTIIHDGLSLTGLSNNLSADSDPVPTNDSTQGYMVGSRWINILAKNEFVLIDSSIGAAIWKKTTGLENLSYHYAEKNNPSRYIYSDFHTHMELTTDVLDQGVYEIWWYYELSNDVSYGTVHGRTVLNTDIIASTDTETREVVSGMIVVNLVGVNIVKIECKYNRCSIPVIQNSRIRLLKLAQQ